MRTTRSQQSREMPHGQTEQTDSQSYPDAGAVILDLDELQTTFLHRHLDISRLCIQTAKKLTYRGRYWFLRHVICPYVGHSFVHGIGF